MENDISVAGESKGGIKKKKNRTSTNKNMIGIRVFLEIFVFSDCTPLQILQHSP